MADYNTLSESAKAFISSLRPQPAGSNNFNTDAIFATLADDASIMWGHKFFVGTMPQLQGEKSGNDFVTNHLLTMAKALGTWEIDISSSCVDVSAKSVVIRADFRMSPPGPNGEAVLNDIIFWLIMDERGEKVVKCTEFIDPSASAELVRRMKAAATG